MTSMAFCDTFPTMASRLGGIRRSEPPSGAQIRRMALPSISDHAAVNREPMRDHKEFLPVPVQELLLKAALFRGPDALRSWDEWKKRVSFRRMDPGSVRLLPLLYQNLVEQGVVDPMLNRLKGSHRFSWYRNKLLFRAAAELITMLTDAGIPTMVLKGAALIGPYYAHSALRPMEDVDLCVPQRAARKAVEIMRRGGWVPTGPLPQNCLFQVYLAIKHGYDFRNPAGHVLDLHWHVMDECIDASADRDFWRHASPIQVAGIQSRALSPEDQVLHICVHGARWSPVPHLRWAADTMMILNRADVRVDWDRLCRKARQLRLTLPLRDSLGYLSSRLGAPIPPDVLKTIEGCPAGRRERRHYRIITCPPGRLGLFWRIKRQSARYRRVAPGAGVPRQILMGFEFLILGLYEFIRGVLWPRLKGVRGPIP